MEACIDTGLIDISTFTNRHLHHHTEQVYACSATSQVSVEPRDNLNVRKMTNKQNPRLGSLILCSLQHFLSCLREERNRI